MKKILVIDDDKDILDAIEMILDCFGYDSKVLQSGEHALEEAVTYKPDLIILDMLLSSYDGRFICKAIKDDVRVQNIPIIMISAHPHADETVRSYGADDFVEKPFSVDSLLTHIKHYTEHARTYSY